MSQFHTVPAAVNADKEKAEHTIHVLEVDPEKIDDSSNLNITAEDNTRVRRKADTYLLPILCVTYGLQFLDKTCLSYASVMGFREDTHLNLSNYAWLSSIFYLGYLTGSYPMTLLQQRLPLSKMTGVNIIVWGAVLCFMAVGKNFTQLMAIRFLLGFFESSIAPALMMYTAQWWRKEEHGFRTGLWVSMNSISSVFGGAIAYGFARADGEGRFSIPGWKVIFILLGCVTVFLGVVFLVFVPDSPEKARFLSTHEKAVAVERVASNRSKTDNAPFKWAQAMECFSDPKVWIYMLISALSCIPNGGVTNFFAILIKGFGFSSQETLLLGMANAWLAFWILTFMYLGDKLRNRCAMAYFPLLISTAGCAMVWTIPNTHRIARLMGYYLMLPYVVPNVIVISFMVTNIAGRTKKTVCNGMYLCFYCAGNLIGPQTFRQKDAPTYAPALITIIVCNGLTAVLMTLLWFLFRRENARRDALVASGAVPAQDDLEADITDKQNPYFRYII